MVKEERQGNERHYDVITLKDEKIKSEKKTEITGAEKNKMFPTDIGMLVNDFLVANFKKTFLILILPPSSKKSLTTLPTARFEMAENVERILHSFP